MDDEAYRKLLDELKKACAEDNPFDRRACAVCAARNFLMSLKAPDELIHLLDDVLEVLIDASFVDKHGNKPGPKPKPFKERARLAFAVAIVKALRDCGWRVEDAINEVCKETNIDKKRLRQVRDNLHRGIGDHVTFDHYIRFTQHFAELPRDRLEDEALSDLRSAWKD
jgi:hypothetical protein